MSHIVTIQTQVRDPAAIYSACRRLGLSTPLEGKARLFSSVETGWLVLLPGWRYPLVCQAKTGELKYDNYSGVWGDPRELERFLQAYAVEKAKVEARRQGHSVSEQPLADGSIRLTIEVAG